MAEIKWIKITTDIWDDEKIKVIEKMPEGDTMLVIWLKLLVLAGKKNDSGFVYLTDTIPYTPDILSDIFNRESRLISLALNTFASFGMIEIENNVINVLNWDRHQNVEGMEKIREQNRLRQQKFRHNRMLLEESNVISRDSNGTDKIREDIDKKEIKDNKEKINKKNLSLSSLNSQPFENWTGEKPKTTKSIFTEITEYWNEQVPKQATPFTAMNMSLSGDIITLLEQTELSVIKTAIDHYGQAYEHNKYRVSGFTNFMTIKNVESWFPESSVENRKGKEEKVKVDEPVFVPGSIDWK